MNNNETNNNINNSISNTSPSINPNLTLNEAINNNNQVNPTPSVNEPQASTPVPDATQVNQPEIPSVEPVVDTLEPTPTVPTGLGANDVILEKPKEETYKSTPNTQTMPGFESSGVVGTTPPPINDSIATTTTTSSTNTEPKKGMNKILFVMLILVILAGIGFGTYYILNYTSIINKSKEATITLHDVDMNLGDSLSLNISDYGTVENTSVSNCILDTSKVDINKAGTYSYTVKCGELLRSAKVNIIDNTPLSISTKDTYISIGDTIDIKDFIIDYDNNLTYTYSDTTTIDTYTKTEGEYSIQIKATNKEGKEATSTSKLYVLPYKIKGYLKCSSKEQNVTGSNATMSLLENIAISLDNNNSYVFGGIEESTYTFKYTDETEYATLKAEYNNSGIVTIGTISGTPEFNDSDMTVTIKILKNRTMLASEIGEDNLKTYSSIMTYYRNTLSYTCTYE